MIIRTFEHQGKRYNLVHNLDDDSRDVVEVGTTDLLVRFDSSMRITNGENRSIGWFSSRDDKWSLCRPGESDLDLGVAVRDYHWVNIEDAEIAATKVLLPCG